MSPAEDGAEEALTGDEIKGQGPAATSERIDRTECSHSPPRKKARNACKPNLLDQPFATSDVLGPTPLTSTVAELMSPSSRIQRDNKSASSAINPHPNRTKPDPHTGVSLNNLHGRDALGVYILKPESFPSPQRVLQYNDKFVTVHDVYAKSTIHLLILPRDLRISALHPFEALADPKFLQSIRDEIVGVKRTVASELRRLFGKYSATEAARNEALAADDPPKELPTGRDWEAEIMVGIHAHPSMSHMHVHVMSRDRHSVALKHRKHYNSFSTRFFVPLDDFPLSEEDERRYPDETKYLAEEMKCWRCDKNYGNKFKALKEHLDEEFEAWKNE